LAQQLADASGFDVVAREIRRFPDSEIYIRIQSELSARQVCLVSSLHPATEQTFVTMLLCAAARDLGAARIRLCAPYLSYLRQDARFQPGEAVTSAYVARFLSTHFDDLVTVDPHLHRYASLDRIYDIPTRTVQSAPAVADWIRREVKNPVLVGPDAESEQWVRDVALRIDCPMVVLEKKRSGDRDVRVRLKNASDRQTISGRTAVVLDDIISTGHTMAQGLAAIADAASESICIGIHAVFSDTDDVVLTRLRQAGANRIITTNTIAHATNAIDITRTLVEVLHG
jgi:ribose-phosphate pyrophosphokinase